MFRYLSAYLCEPQFSDKRAVPCTSERMLEKSLTTSSDVIIYDLEDSVPPAPASKQAARDRLEGFLKVGDLELLDFSKTISFVWFKGSSGRLQPERVAIRLNRHDTPFFGNDVDLAVC